ncbi:hypothetical protein VTK73DRAFT_1876 [Phialemonium thermophilum]|uniref:Peptidase A1 domain-containing protein n=1 Tax=Phialemonium thermophilum TaxID=223376 RepID=A0ABR3VSW9_9PEZI
MGYYLRRAPGLCVFGVQNSSMEGYYLLGGGLLRRSYLVFDLVNQEVAVAAAKFASSSSATPTIVEFASYGALVPSSTPYCSSSRSSSSSGSAARCRGSSTGSGSSSGGGDGTTSSGGHTVISKYASMRNRDIAIGLGVSIGAIALAGLVAAMVVWKRVCFGGRHDGDDDVGKGKASALPEVETVPASVPLLAPPAPPAATAATTGAGDGDASSAAGSLSGRDRALSTVPEAGETHPSDAPPTVPRIPHVEDIHMRDSHSPDAQDQEDTNAGSSATGNQVSSASAASEGAELQRPDRGEELHTGRGEAEVDTSSGVDGHGERRDADVGTPLRL